MKDNWKKIAANTLKGAALFGAGYVVGKKLTGGEQYSESDQVVDAEFKEIENDDVNVDVEE